LAEVAADLDPHRGGDDAARVDGEHFTESDVSTALFFAIAMPRW
jgi:hypothetical protein